MTIYLKDDFNILLIKIYIALIFIISVIIKLLMEDFMANLNYYKYKLKQFTITDWLIAINIIMFVLTYILDFFGLSGLVLLGAKVNFLIAAGQYYRLIFAMFLHGSIMHIVFNMMALKILGRDIERFFGKKKFLIIYFGAGLLGTAASYFLMDGTSVGASGAIFGLMGANLYLYWRNPMVYKRIFGSDILILIGVNLILSFLSSNIDIAGHIGGLIGGFIIAFGVQLKHEKWPTPKGAAILGFYTLLTTFIIAFSTYLNYNDESFYINISAYRYTQSNFSSAATWATRGLEKFPGSDTLTLILNESESYIQ